MASATPQLTEGSSNMDQLQAMGYSENKSATALRIAHGDMEQAINWLLMGESSQQAFDYSFRESICDDGSIPAGSQLPSTTNSNGSIDLLGIGVGPTALEVSNTQQAASPEEQLVMMGYSHNQAIHALRTAEGDLEQALNFLAMGDSRQGFLLDIEHFSSEQSLRSSSNSNPANSLGPTSGTSGALSSPRNHCPLPSSGPNQRLFPQEAFSVSTLPRHSRLATQQVDS